MNRQTDRHRLRSIVRQNGSRAIAWTIIHTRPQTDTTENNPPRYAIAARVVIKKEKAPLP